MNNLKEINVKNCTCYYFDDLQMKILILIIFHWIKKHMKMTWFMTVHTKF